MDEEAIQRLKDIVAKRRATFLRAEILDQDSRPLATGEATPASEGAFQVFHIDNPKDADTLSDHAKVLRRSDGSETKILRCERCPQSVFSLHFHLETQA